MRVSNGRSQSKRRAPSFLAPIVALPSALERGAAESADDTGTDGGQAPPTPAAADPPQVGIGMELCVGQRTPCRNLPWPEGIASASVTIRVECENAAAGDCTNAPIDKAPANGTEMGPINDTGSFGLGSLNAGETRAMEAKIPSSTLEHRHEAGIDFNLNVER